MMCNFSVRKGLLEEDEGAEWGLCDDDNEGVSLVSGNRETLGAVCRWVETETEAPILRGL